MAGPVPKLYMTLAPFAFGLPFWSTTSAACMVAVQISRPPRAGTGCAL